VVIPYGKRHFYAETYPASSVAAHAIAYRTPVVCTDYGSLAEFGTETGAVVVPMDSDDPKALPAGFSAAIAALLNDEARLKELQVNVCRTREERSPENVAAAYAAKWSEMLTRQGRLN
jgi:polysaccharide biosynthesis protein PslF